MSTWYAVESNNWTNTGTVSPGNGIWNSANDASGSYGTPTGGDTCNLNSFTVNWDFVLDGATFVAVSVVGAGTFYFSGLAVTLGNTTFNGTFDFGSASPSSVVIPTGVIFTITQCGNMGLVAIEVQSGGILLVTSLTDGGGNTITVDGGGFMQSAVPVAGITVNAGGVLELTAGNWGAKTIVNNGTVLSYDTLAGAIGTITGNPQVVVPAPARVLTTTTFYGPAGNGGTPITGGSIAGTYVGPTADNVNSGSAYGPGGAVNGTLLVPNQTDVRNGTPYGPGSALTGSLSASGGLLVAPGMTGGING